jgi:hypothetical protein
MSLCMWAVPSNGMPCTCNADPDPQAVRKNGSGYYLVLHPLHAAAGRPDFVPWLLAQQQDSMAGLPSPLPHLSKKPVSGANPRLRHLADPLVLRQLSRDLGGPKLSQGAPAPQAAKPPPPQADALLNILANLGLATPAVTTGRPASNPVAEDDEVRGPTQSMPVDTDKQQLRNDIKS